MARKGAKVASPNFLLSLKTWQFVTKSWKEQLCGRVWRLGSVGHQKLKKQLCGRVERHGSAADSSELLRLRLITLLWCTWYTLLHNTSSTDFLAIVIWGSKSSKLECFKVATKNATFCRSYDALSMHHNKLCIKTKHCFVNLSCCYTTDRGIECSMLKTGSSPEVCKTGPFRASQKESSILLIHEPRDLNNLVAFLGLFLEPQNHDKNCHFYDISLLCQQKAHTIFTLSSHINTSLRSYALSLLFISLHYTHIKHDFIVFWLNLQPLARARRGGAKNRPFFGALENGLKNVVF